MRALSGFWGWYLDMARAKRQTYGVFLRNLRVALPRQQNRRQQTLQNPSTKKEIA